MSYANGIFWRDATDAALIDPAASSFPGHPQGVQSRERSVLTGSFLEAAPPRLPLTANLCGQCGGWGRGSLAPGRLLQLQEKSCRETSGPPPGGPGCLVETEARKDGGGSAPTLGAQTAPLSSHAPTSVFRDPAVELRSSAVRTPSECGFPVPSPRPRLAPEEPGHCVAVRKFMSRAIGDSFFPSAVENSPSSPRLFWKGSAR